MYVEIFNLRGLKLSVISRCRNTSYFLIKNVTSIPEHPLIFEQIKRHEHYVLRVDLIRILLAENLPLICDAFSTAVNIPKSYEENLEITDLFK